MKSETTHLQFFYLFDVRVLGILISRSKQIEILTEVKAIQAAFGKTPGKNPKDSGISKSVAAGLGVGHKFKPRIRTGMRN